ncbi:hypothetical protein F3Y22_tig00112863pilonHSYRG00014 [Hibiscus syriacus]|uniref:DYW domain-containing protein n=1 Tax=Hibiscus syriacus TaxID=106335 RepID=A0A6A2WTA1_HIBSY|nr:hypothetical protein F3Y22_tig00112863pilonHSYRG00014 [Hibiscus syriacus]
MIRLFTGRALRPSNLFSVHRKINPFSCFSTCGFSAQAAAIQTRQNPSSANEPCSHFDSYKYGSLLQLFQGCAQCLQFSEAVGLVSRLHREGHELNPFLGHEYIAFVETALIDAYSVCGCVHFAREVFDGVRGKDMVTWTGMVACYAENDYFQEALEAFSQMRLVGSKPNNFTFAGVFKAWIGLETFDIARGVHGTLQACATLGDLDLGKQMHGLVFKVCLDADVFISNALMDVYAKCGRIEDSMKLFEKSPNRNDLSWNTLIVGYVNCGDAEKALDLFMEMLENRVQGTEVTYSSILCASSSLTALELGTQIHSLTVKTNYAENTVVHNALIDMYSKCGRVKDARSVFDKMNERDEVSWNIMISGYSMHGLGMEALNIFQMMKDRGYKTNTLTFVGLLSACSNSGLLDQGQNYFSSMLQGYGIEPCIEHYSCVVWLLGRSCHLNKALKLIEEIPFKPSVMVWRALLGACVIHNNVELGRISAQRILELEPQDDATYVLLSNMYATARKWDNVAAIRQNMRKKGMKEPGLSWIKNQGRVHYFSVGDTSHPDTMVINGILEWLNLRTRTAGFVPNCNAVLLDVEHKEKERFLWVQYERSALAYHYFELSPRSQICIIKNLRMCGLPCCNEINIKDRAARYYYQRYEPVP